MTPTPPKRYDTPPKSASTLDVRLRNIIQADYGGLGRVEQRLRREVAGIILGQLLLRVRDGEGDPVFLIKGGVAMSMRLGLRSRATKDYDVACRIEIEPALDLLRDEMVDGWGPFTFTFVQDEPQPIHDTGAVRIDIRETFGDNQRVPWARVQLEISESEGQAGQEFEMTSSRLLELDRLGLDAPREMPLVTVAYLIAQKLHACTDHSNPDRLNDRYRDLIDIQLLEPSIDADELLRIKSACEEIFGLREKHDWPPTITVVDGWEAGYKRMAEEMGFAVTDVHEAKTRVDEFVKRVQEAEPTA